MTVTIPPLTTSTNLGPVTSTISFPNDCLSNLYDFQTFGLGLPWSYETQGCALSTCCPSNNFYTQGFAWLTSYYSPGVCPSAYKTCGLPSYYSDWSTSSGESIALCCPSNYECPEGVTASYAVCQSLLATSTDVVVLNNIFDQQTVSTRPFTIPASLQAEGYSSYQIAYPIQIRWKSNDFVSATTTGGSPTNQSPGQTATQTISPATPTSSSSSSSSSLSTGTIAGIATGTISAVVAILGLVFRVYKWKHPKKQPVVIGVNNEPQKLSS